MLSSWLRTWCSCSRPSQAAATERQWTPSHLAEEKCAENYHSPTIRSSQLTQTSKAGVRRSDERDSWHFDSAAESVAVPNSLVARKTNSPSCNRFRSRVSLEIQVFSSQFAILITTAPNTAALPPWSVVRTFIVCCPSGYLVVSSE